MSAEVRAGYKQTAVGLVPVDWNCERLGDVANIRSGIAKNSASVIVDPISVHYLRVANVQDGFLDLEEVSTIRIARSDLGRYLLLAGDVLMNEGGDKDKLGRGAVWNGDFAPCIHQNHVFAVRCGQRLDPDFLSLWTAGRGARQFFLLAGKQTTNLASISKTALDGLPVVVPPMCEQVAIRTALGDFDKILDGLGRLMAKKRDLKWAAIQQLLTGRIRLPGFTNDWQVSTVGQQFEITLGKMLDAEKNVGVPKPYIGNRAVQWGRIDTTERQEMRMAPADLDRYRLLKGDLLVCEGGEVGRAAIWNASVEECYFQKALHRLRPRQGFNPQLMVDLLRLWADRGMLLNYVTQTSIAHLPREKFMQVPMSVPPIPEQTAIAEVLADMDAELTALEARRDKTLALKQAMMQELLTGKTRLA